MGHKILKSRLKYAVLNKQTKKVDIIHLQKDLSTLFKVSRKTIYRKLEQQKLENEVYIVYLVRNVP